MLHLQKTAECDALADRLIAAHTHVREAEGSKRKAVRAADTLEATSQATIAEVSSSSLPLHSHTHLYESTKLCTCASMYPLMCPLMYSHMYPRIHAQLQLQLRITALERQVSTLTSHNKLLKAKATPFHGGPVPQLETPPPLVLLPKRKPRKHSTVHDSATSQGADDAAPVVRAASPTPAVALPAVPAAATPPTAIESLLAAPFDAPEDDSALRNDVPAQPTDPFDTDDGNADDPMLASPAEQVRANLVPYTDSPPSPVFAISPAIFDDAPSVRDAIPAMVDCSCLTARRSRRRERGVQHPAHHERR